MARFLTKEIDTVYGVKASMLTLNGTTFTGAPDGMKVQLRLGLWYDVQAAIDRKATLDEFTAEYFITDEQAKGDTEIILLNMIMSSILDEEGQESNGLTGRASTQYFQDAILTDTE